MIDFHEFMFFTMLLRVAYRGMIFENSLKTKTKEVQSSYVIRSSANLRRKGANIPSYIRVNHFASKNMSGLFNLAENITLR